MTLTKQVYPYEVLIRFNPDGTVRGAHRVDMETIMDDGELMSEKPCDAMPVTADDLAGLIGENAAALVASNAALSVQLADAEADARSAAERLTAAQSEIASLNGQIAAITDPGASVHKAYFRAALAAMEKLAAVDTFMATQSTLKQELWAGATTIDITDKDIVAIAAALEIDLAAVLARAQQIRAGDRGAA